LGEANLAQGQVKRSGRHQNAPFRRTGLWNSPEEAAEARAVKEKYAKAA